MLPIRLKRENFLQWSMIWSVIDKSICVKLILEAFKRVNNHWGNPAQDNTNHSTSCSRDICNTMSMGRAVGPICKGWSCHSDGTNAWWTPSRWDNPSHTDYTNLSAGPCRGSHTSCACRTVCENSCNHVYSASRMGTTSPSPSCRCHICDHVPFFSQVHMLHIRLGGEISRLWGWHEQTRLQELSICLDIVFTEMKRSSTAYRTHISIWHVNLLENHLSQGKSLSHASLSSVFVKSVSIVTSGTPFYQDLLLSYVRKHAKVLSEELFIFGVGLHQWFLLASFKVGYLTFQIWDLSQK